MAATTLVAAGLLVSTLDFEDLPLAGVAVFLLLSDFCSIAIVVLLQVFDLTALRNTLVQAEGQTLNHRPTIVKTPENKENGR
jgi:hypothetical protein